MAELPTKHPNVARKCRAGNFTIQKMKKVLSTIAIYPASKEMAEQLASLTTPGTLLRRMVARPEVARALEEFQEGGLQGRPCVGPDTATGTLATSTNQQPW